MRKSYISPLVEDIVLEALMGEPTFLGVNQTSAPQVGLTAE